MSQVPLVSPGGVHIHYAPLQNKTKAWTSAPQPNLTLDMISHTQQKSTNPWISVPCALT